MRRRRLHYDFRLELDGVLMSWAVPKGPSLDPGEKRLAVHVEDHPLDYGGFEGVIPKGQYGGGTVLLWDRGTWTPLKGPTRRRPTGRARSNSASTARNCTAIGRWCGWAARRAEASGHENWLLIKERDEEAVPGSDAALVDDNPLSVATGRSMDADRRRPRPGLGLANAAKSPATRRNRRRRKEPPRRRLRRRAQAGDARPHRAAARDPGRGSAPEGDEWLHEIKYDGYRLLARIERRQGPADHPQRARLDRANFRRWPRRSPNCRSTPR